MIGIEPEYRGRGYARLLKQRAKDIANKWCLDIIIGYMIGSSIMKGLNERMGYTLYNGGEMSVKRLVSK